MAPSIRTWGFYVAVTSCISLIFSSAVIAISLYTLIDIGDIFELFLSQLYRNGAYIALFVGIITFIVCLFAIVGVLVQNRLFLIVSVALYFIGCVLLIVAGIIVLISPLQMNNDESVSFMEDSLVNWFNRTAMITRAWERAQSKMRCCAVKNNGWLLYRKSYWSNYTNKYYFMPDIIPEWNPFYKMVPESCCFRIIDDITQWPTDIPINIEQCQHSQFGPPKYETGPQNDALYYRGCFNATISYLNHYGKYIGPLYLISAIVHILAFVCCLAYLMRGGKNDKYE